MVSWVSASISWEKKTRSNDGLGTYPTIVVSTIQPESYSLTIYNASSSPKTLKTLLIVVLIGIPLVLAYGWWVDHIFRGKVKLHKSSY